MNGSRNGGQTVVGSWSDESLFDDLAHRVAWQLADEVHGAWALVGREHGGNVIREFALARH
jgi:hypothetical protein